MHFPGFLSKSDNLQFTFIENIDISIFYHENSDRFPQNGGTGMDQRLHGFLDSFSVSIDC